MPLRFSTSPNQSWRTAPTRPGNHSPTPSEPPLIMAEDFSFRPKNKPTPMHLRRQATDLEEQPRRVESSSETKRQNDAESRLLSQIKCYNCANMGHYGIDCLEPRNPHYRTMTFNAEQPSAPELFHVNSAIKAHMRRTNARESDLNDDAMDTKSIYHAARTLAAAHTAAQDEPEDQDIQQIRSLLQSIHDQDSHSAMTHLTAIMSGDRHATPVVQQHPTPASLHASATSHVDAKSDSYPASYDTRGIHNKLYSADNMESGNFSHY
jgi:hypothetical protein